MTGAPSLPPDFQQNVHDALTLWHKDSSFGSPLDYLSAVQQAMTDPHTTLRLATNRVLLAALTTLETDREADAALLRRRFLDDKPAFAVANELNMAEPTLFRRQRQAIRRLAEILYAADSASRSQRAALMERRAPAAGQGILVGIDPHVGHLSHVLASGGPPWLVSIDGIGGIGKTTLALQVARRLVVDEGAFTDLAWVSAQQQTFHPGGFIQPVAGPALTVAGLIEGLAAQLLPAGALPIPFSAKEALGRLQARLHETPCLVVIDNLETLVDAATLLPALRQLAGPTRFLLTSRATLRVEPDVYCHSVPELSEADTLRLLRIEARLRNLQSVATAQDDELRPIFDTVGGNPLALKLVAGQLYLLPLSQVLDNLRAARGRKADELYRFIYQDAWHKLDADCQEVLLTMPLFAQNGADFAALERVSEVTGDRLLEVLERLANLSLVIIGGDLHARRFSVHRLTETFLLNDVIGWRTVAGRPLESAR